MSGYVTVPRGGAHDPSEACWFVGDVETAGWCDFIPAGSDDACDGPADYEVRWLPAPHIGDDPVSTVCAEHAVLVDRSEVRSISTHPEHGRQLATTWTPS